MPIQISFIKRLPREIEFFLLLSWLLLYPQKDSPLYFLGLESFYFLLIVRKMIKLKSLEIGLPFYFLLGFNLVMAAATLFSPAPWQSILLVSDFLLISLYFILSEYSPSEEESLWLSIGGVVSLSSLANILVFAISPGHPVSLFFTNPILMGITGGIGTLIFLHFCTPRCRWYFLLLLSVNLTSMIITTSKAAFLGTFLCAVFYLLRHARFRIFYPLLILLLIILVPNPLKQRTAYTLKNDPYAFDRIRIWKMSMHMFVHHPWTGVGPGLFDEQANVFNFPQEKGLSRYGKIPESPHSDYLKIITETGIPGLLFMFLSILMALRKGRHPIQPSITKLVLLYLLFQSLFINYIFEPFFFFLFLFSIRFLFSGSARYHSPRDIEKTMALGLLTVFFLLTFVSPFLGQTYTSTALHHNRTLRSKLHLLDRASFFCPFDDQPYQKKGEASLEHYENTGNLPSALDALACFRQAQSLNPFLFSAYQREAELFSIMSRKKMEYPGMGKEIIRPLQKQERLAPLNPFLQFQLASVHLRLGDKKRAGYHARKAVELEPNYISAHYFLHRHFGVMRDETLFQQFISGIRSRVARKKLIPGTYLYELYKIPSSQETEFYPQHPPLLNRSLHP